MNDIKDIPKTSLLYVPVGNMELDKSVIKKHDSVVIASFSNNEKIMALPDSEFDSKWVFQKEDLSDEIFNGYLGKHLLAIPRIELLKLTDFRTIDVNQDDEDDDPLLEHVLVCVLPTVLNKGDCGITKLMNIIMLTGYFSVSRIPDFLNYKGVIKDIKTENKKFWKRWAPDSKVLTRYFKTRRFRNEEFIQTEDYETIKNINEPIKVETYTFMKENENNPDSSNNIDTIKETWDGTEWKDELRGAMGIQPLDPSDYEAYCTYEGMEEMFKTASRLDDGANIVKELYVILLKNFFCCHLIFRNKFLMKKLNKIMVKLNNGENALFNRYNIYQRPDKNDIQENITELNRSLMHGLYILYAEEMLLGGNLTLDHRSVWKYDTAHLLPVYTGISIHNSPYLCLPIAPEELTLENTLIGLTYRDEVSEYRARDYIYHLQHSNHNPNPIRDDIRNRIATNDVSEYTKFARHGLQRRGILDPNVCIKNMQSYMSNIFNDFEDPEIYLTGSGAEACVYNNPLFRKDRYQLSDLYPERSYNYNVNTLKYEDAHKHSDIDLVVFTNDENVLKKKAESILRYLEEEDTMLNSKIEMIKVNDTKYRFTGDSMPREIDLFMCNRNPASLLYNYHISTCRVLIPFTQNPSIVKSQTIMMQSMVSSAHLGFCIDRRWFSSKTSIYDRILRQYSRGIGMLLNSSEMQMLRDYINNSDKWNHLANIITMEQYHPNDDASLPQKTKLNVRHPGLSGNFYSTKPFKVGQYFETTAKRLQQDPYTSMQLQIDDRTCNSNMIPHYKFSPSEKSTLKNKDGSFYIRTKISNIQLNIDQ